MTAINNDQQSLGGDLSQGVVEVLGGKGRFGNIEADIVGNEVIIVAGFV